MDFLKSTLGKLVVLALILALAVLTIIYGGPVLDFFKRAGDRSLVMMNTTESMEFDSYNDEIVPGSMVLAAARSYKTSVDVGVYIIPKGSSGIPFYAENSSGAEPYYTISMAGTPPLPVPGSVVGAKATSPVTRTTLQMGSVSGISYVNPGSSYRANVHVDDAGKERLLSFTEL